MEREWRAKSINNNKISRYAFYKKQKVLEYANFVINKYYSDHKYNKIESYSLNNEYFVVNFKKGTGENAESIYTDTGY
jgi:hypothetical protein